MFQANFVCTLALEVVSSMFLACFLLTPVMFRGTSQDIYKNNSCFEEFLRRGSCGKVSLLCQLKFYGNAY